MSTDRLELLLHEVADEVEFPETPDLTGRVGHRIAHDPLAPERRPRRTWLRPALAIGLVIVLIGFFTLAFSPTARRAVADLLGIVGIRITIDGGGGTPDAPAPEDLGEVDLGRRVSLAEARARADFEVRVPDDSVQGGWLRTVFFDPGIGESGMVSLVYQSDATDDEDIEFLVTQFRASVDEAFFKKVLATTGNVRFVDVNGTTGYWITGEPHFFAYVEQGGRFREETIRLAGDVLIWEEGGIAHRVEGAANLIEAQEIASSLR